MVSTDPVSDMLTRIRNAILVNKTEVSIPHSKLKMNVAEQLKTAGYIEEVKTDGDGVTKKLHIVIHKPDSNARITEISRVSKPGRRVYAAASDIPVVKNGRGLVVVSTSKGIMSGDEARKQNIGGEVICEVY